MVPIPELAIRKKEAIRALTVELWGTFRLQADFFKLHRRLRSMPMKFVFKWKISKHRQHLNMVLNKETAFRTLKMQYFC